MNRFIQPHIFLYFFLLILGISGFFFMVVWPQAVGFYAFIALAAVGGFGVALYIYYTKKHNKQLVCPIGLNCNVVITSRYSQFLGLPLEYLGMFYYAVIFAAYVILIFAPHILSQLFLFGLEIFTAAAFFFALYLLFVQAFILRQWCIWCILSAALSIGIFIISLASVNLATAFLTEAQTIIGAIHALGFVLGMGGATTALFLFLIFLRDRTIDEKELQTLKDKKIAADVLWKRLEIGMALQVDAAPVTYENRGLPEMPIANPGLSSIEDAIYSIKNSYWYYLSTKEGETIFSQTLEEHNIAKARYLQ